MNQLIYIRRRLKTIVSPKSGMTPINVLAAMQRNLENLGYQLSEDVLEVLKTYPLQDLEAFYQRLVKDLQVLVGAHRKFTPMYPNFPQQVMGMTEAELYFNALRHYRSLQRPNNPPEERTSLDEPIKYRVIGLGNRAEFEELFTLLTRSKSPFSPQDKEDIRWFVAQYRDGLERLLPPAIPSKENLAVLGAALLRETSIGNAFLQSQIKTATDVLRLAVALSDGDVSLATACKFGKFRRRERALLLECIEKSSSRTEDMLRWKPRWVRLGERLHLMIHGHSHIASTRRFASQPSTHKRGTGISSLLGARNRCTPAPSILSPARWGWPS